MGLLTVGVGVSLIPLPALETLPPTRLSCPALIGEGFCLVSLCLILYCLSVDFLFPEEETEEWIWGIH